MIEAIFLGTIIPIVFLILVLKGENRLMMLFFSWGLIAFVISLFINSMIIKHFDFSQSQLSVTWAPLVEELFKALPLICFFIKTNNTDYPIIYFAMASGIGFSIQENYLYLINNYGVHGSLIIFIIIRSITTCIMHGISISILGFGLQIIKKIKGFTLPLLFGLFSLSVTIHSLFNLYIDSSMKLFGMVLPILLYLIGLSIIKGDNKPNDNVST